jgi:hypothetical protein
MNNAAIKSNPFHSDCEQQVRLMARRTALLHHAFAATLIEELGEEEGKKLIQKAIQRYGEACGSAVKQGVEALGLPLTQENYGKIPDLPNTGWEKGSVTTPEGETHAIITYCPLADVFESLGCQELGRLYCYVDQAKQQAYNPEHALVHVKNILDGDPYCEFALIPVKNG